MTEAGPSKPTRGPKRRSSRPSSSKSKSSLVKRKIAETLDDAALQYVSNRTGNFQILFTF